MEFYCLVINKYKSIRCVLCNGAATKPFKEITMNFNLDSY